MGLLHEVFLFSVMGIYVGLVGMPNYDDKSYGIPMAFR